MPEDDVDPLDFGRHMNDAMNEALSEWTEEHGKVNPMWYIGFLEARKEAVVDNA